MKYAATSELRVSWIVRGSRLVTGLVAATLLVTSCGGANSSAPPTDPAASASASASSSVDPLAEPQVAWTVSQPNVKQVFGIEQGLVLLPGDDGGTMRLLSWENGAEIWSTKLTGLSAGSSFYNMRELPEGRFTITTRSESGQSNAQVFDSATGTQVAQLPGDDRVTYGVMASGNAYRLGYIGANYEESRGELNRLASIDERAMATWVSGVGHLHQRGHWMREVADTVQVCQDNPAGGPYDFTCVPPLRISDGSAVASAVGLLDGVWVGESMAFMTSEGHVKAYNVDGTELWSSEVGKSRAGDLAAWGDSLLFLDGNRYGNEGMALVGLDPATGKELWRNSDIGGQAQVVIDDDSRDETGAPVLVRAQPTLQFATVDMASGKATWVGYGAPMVGSKIVRTPKVWLVNTNPTATNEGGYDPAQDKWLAIIPGQPDQLWPTVTAGYQDFEYTGGHLVGLNEDSITLLK